MAPPREQQLTASKNHECSLALSDRVRALAQELIDMIYDHIFDFDTIPSHANIEVTSSYRIPAVLQVNQALRKKHRVRYYTTNTFILENPKVHHKWCWAMFEAIEYDPYLGRISGPPKYCTTCDFPCGLQNTRYVGFWLRWRVYAGTQSQMEDMKWVVRIGESEPDWRRGQRAQWERCLRQAARRELRRHNQLLKDGGAGGSNSSSRKVT